MLHKFIHSSSDNPYRITQVIETRGHQNTEVVISIELNL
jgi:hypothetical protein